MSYDSLAILDGRGKNLSTTSYSYKTGMNGAGQYALDAIISELKDSEIDTSKMCVMVPYADGQRRDGVGDLLEVGGIDLSRHRKNAISLFDHAKNHQLPIGMCLERDGTRYDPSKYTVELDQVAQVARANIYFYQGKGFEAGSNGESRKVPLSREDEYEHALFCEQTFDLVAKRMLNGGSIGYQVKRAEPLQPDYRTGTPQGLHLLETLQLEVSIVVLPANADTVRKALSDNRCCGKPLAACLVKSLTPHAAPRKAQLGYEGKGSHVPFDEDLSNADKIPPARWKPGLGAEKGQPSDKISPEKARQILKDGEVNGHPLTEKQRGMFGAAAGRKDMKELRKKYHRKAHHVPTSYALRSGGHSTNAGEFHDFEVGQWVRARQGLTWTDPRTREVGNFVSAGEKVRVLSVNSDGSMEVQNERGMMKTDWARNFRKGLEKSQSTDRFVASNQGMMKGQWKVVDTQDGSTVRSGMGSKVAAQREADKFNLEGRPGISGSTKSLPGLRQKYRRPAKGFRRVLKKSSPGSALVYVRGKDLEACRNSAEKCGLKFTHMGRHRTGLEKIKVQGDDKHIDAVAREWGRSVKAVKGGKSMAAKNVTDDSGHEHGGGSTQSHKVVNLGGAGYAVKVGKEYLSAHGGGWTKHEDNAQIFDSREDAEAAAKKAKRKSLQGANGMKTKGKALISEEEVQDEPVELEEPGEGAGEQPAQEPYGAQARRRVHQDLSILMREYDQIRQLCEHEQVNAHLEELLQTFGEHLERIETEWEADEVHKELPPIEGAMSQKDMEEEGEEEKPNEPEEEPVESSSGDSEEEEVDEDEAVEAMKGLYRNVKALRKSLKQTEEGKKALIFFRHSKGLCGACGKGKKGLCKCSKSMDDPEDIPGSEEHQDKPGHPGMESDFKLLPHHKKHVGEAHGFLGEVGGMDGGAWGDEHRMKSFHFHKALENVADELEAHGKSEIPGDREYWREEAEEPEHGEKALTEDELGKIEGEMETQAEDTEDHPAGKALRSASSFFKELSLAHELTPDHQVKAMACHKELNPLLHQAEDDLDVSRDAKEEVGVEVGEMGEKALLTLKKQNDEHAQKMKDLSSTIVRLAKLAN